MFTRKKFTFSSIGRVLDELEYQNIIYCWCCCILLWRFINL